MKGWLQSHLLPSLSGNAHPWLMGAFYLPKAQYWVSSRLCFSPHSFICILLETFCMFCQNLRTPWTSPAGNGTSASYGRPEHTADSAEVACPTWSSLCWLDVLESRACTFSLFSEGSRVGCGAPVWCVCRVHLTDAASQCVLNDGVFSVRNE